MTIDKYDEDEIKITTRIALVIWTVLAGLGLFLSAWAMGFF